MRVQGRARNLIDELGFKNALFWRYVWHGIKLKRSDHWNEKSKANCWEKQWPCDYCAM